MPNDTPKIGFYTLMPELVFRILSLVDKHEQLNTYRALRSVSKYFRDNLANNQYLTQFLPEMKQVLDSTVFREDYEKKARSHHLDTEIENWTTYQTKITQAWEDMLKKCVIDSPEFKEVDNLIKAIKSDTTSLSNYFQRLRQTITPNEIIALTSAAVILICAITLLVADGEVRKHLASTKAKLRAEGCFEGYGYNEKISKNCTDTALVSQYQSLAKANSVLIIVALLGGMLGITGAITGSFYILGSICRRLGGNSTATYTQLQISSLHQEHSVLWEKIKSFFPHLRTAKVTHIDDILTALEKIISDRQAPERVNINDLINAFTDLQHLITDEIAELTRLKTAESMKGHKLHVKGERFTLVSKIYGFFEQCDKTCATFDSTKTPTVMQTESADLVLDHIPTTKPTTTSPETDSSDDSDFASDSDEVSVPLIPRHRK